MRVFEVCNGDKSDFFGHEEDAKDFAKSAYDNNEDGVPFIVPHFVERPDEFAELLNKVTARRSGQATGAIRSANPCASEDSTTHGH
ncbi:MAG: hypothetical protein L7S70_01660 [Pseudomonadales bacterium]|nr:hypothetical protein [Pseudomonadales bacterium]